MVCPAKREGSFASGLFQLWPAKGGLGGGGILHVQSSSELEPNWEGRHHVEIMYDNYCAKLAFRGSSSPFRSMVVLNHLSKFSPCREEY